MPGLEQHLDWAGGEKKGKVDRGSEDWQAAQSVWTQISGTRRKKQAESGAGGKNYFQKVSSKDEKALSSVEATLQN